MSYPPHTGYSFVDTLHHDIYPAIDPTKSELSQPSKVVLITGPGRGIGRSIALTASELDDVGQAIKKINTDIRVHKFTLDISDESKVLAVAEAVKKEEGRLDILVNNAGTGDPWQPITDGIADDYWRTVTVNLKGPYLLMKSFLPLMVETAKTTGTIVDVVNISSIGATAVTPGALSYQVSKLAVTRLTEFVQVEYGAQGVNCVAVHPGGVLTDLSKGIPPQFQASLVDTPDLCGGFLVWLTHGERSWLNGRYISALWDVNELEAKKVEIVEGDKPKFRMVV